MAAGKGWKEAAKWFTATARRVDRPNPAMTAIGKNAVNRHIGYYRRTGDQTAPGGGPPGDNWPGLEESTALAKSKGWGRYRGNKSRKLINTGLLSRGYEYRASKDQTEIFNRETDKVHYLQTTGVGKKKKKFTVVATEPEKQDPQIIKDSEEIMMNYLFDGKAVK